MKRLEAHSEIAGRPSFENENSPFGAEVVRRVHCPCKTPQNIGAIIHDGFTGDIGTMPNAQVIGLACKDIANS